MTQINPKKLLHSKWTAVKPQNKEKHFIISELEFDESEAVTVCIIQAVINKREFEIDWRQLKDTQLWRQGWK